MKGLLKSSNEVSGRKNPKFFTFCLKCSLVGMINTAPTSQPFHTASKGINRE